MSGRHGNIVHREYPLTSKQYRIVDAMDDDWNKDVIGSFIEPAKDQSKEDSHDDVREFAAPGQRGIVGNTEETTGDDDGWDCP